MLEKEWDREELDWILGKSLQIETPFFLLNEKRLKDNVDFLKKIAVANFAVCFSVKANPWYAIKAAENADYVEVCSHGEWELCRRQGISAAKIIVGGICKSDKELKELVEARPHRISIESMQQLKQVDKHTSVSGIRADILLRISSGNQFGMDPDLVIDILKHQDRFPSLRSKGFIFILEPKRDRWQKLKRILT